MGAQSVEASLPFPHLGQLLGGLAVPGARLLPETGPGSGQLRGLIVEAAVDELQAPGQVGQSALAVRLHDLLVHFLLKEIFSLSGHAPRQGGQGNPAGGNTAGSAEQEQVLDGALLLRPRRWSGAARRGATPPVAVPLQAPHAHRLRDHPLEDAAGR